jgi:hypothetical protein
VSSDISANGPSAHNPATNGAEWQPHADRSEDRVLRERVHLLAADGALAEPCLDPPRQYFTLCGQVITDMDLPHETCPDDTCNCELRYCPTCLRYATGWNAEIEDEMQAPGWTARVGFDGEIDASAGVIVPLGSSSAPGGAPAPQRP